MNQNLKSFRLLLYFSFGLKPEFFCVLEALILDISINFPVFRKDHSTNINLKLLCSDIRWIHFYQIDFVLGSNLHFQSFVMTEKKNTIVTVDEAISYFALYDE